MGVNQKAQDKQFAVSLHVYQHRYIEDNEGERHNRNESLQKFFMHSP